MRAFPSSFLPRRPSPRGRRWRRAGAAAAALLLLAALPVRARAADLPDPAALEASLRDWLAGLLGPEVALGARPVRLAAEGDHLALTVPVAGTVGQSGVTLAGPPFTARLTPLPDGRWALEDGKLPSPLRITGPAGQDWTVTLRDQTQRALLDPSLASVSSWDAQAGEYATTSHGPGGEQRNEARNLRMHLVWQPAAQGRVDLRETASSDLLTSNARLPRGGLIAFSAGHSDVASHVNGLAPAQLGPALRAMLRIMALIGQGGATIGAAHGALPVPARLTPALRAALGALLAPAGELMTGAGQRARFDNVHVHVQGFDVAMRRLEFDDSYATPDGRLLLRFGLAMQGLDSASRVAAPFGRFLPRHVVLRQRVGGLPMAGVLALLRAAARQAPPREMTAQLAALLRQGPLAIGLDEFAADLGPATLSATGALRVAGEDMLTGQADIRATGLDALIGALRSDPMLQQAVPVLIFLKGLGEAQGAATVWTVAYQDGRLTVNGTDLSQLVPGGR